MAILEKDDNNFIYFVNNCFILYFKIYHFLFAYVDCDYNLLDDFDGEYFG